MLDILYYSHKAPDSWGFLFDVALLDLEPIKIMHLF